MIFIRLILKSLIDKLSLSLRNTISTEGHEKPQVENQGFFPDTCSFRLFVLYSFVFYSGDSIYSRKQCVPLLQLRYCNHLLLRLFLYDNKTQDNFYECIL
jgi:hypothetical protein